MTVESMNDLFLETLKDIHYAEKHILKSLPAMIKKANGGELKDALETHRKETEGQIPLLTGLPQAGYAVGCSLTGDWLTRLRPFST
jgi:ferritin-like metal-binding protein YciE